MGGWTEHHRVNRVAGVVAALVGTVAAILLLSACQSGPVALQGHLTLVGSGQPATAGR